MALTNPYRQHNYMGEYANDGACLTFIQANKWDSSGDGFGLPRPGQWYYNTTGNTVKYYNGSSWVRLLGGIIDHTDPTEITNVGTNTHAQIDTHIADLTKHRIINDAGTSTTELWSANKINAEIAAVVSGSHRKTAVIAYADASSAPPTEVTGDRYILDDQTPVDAGWDGASNLDIVEFNGSTWDAETPEEGWITYVDGDNADRQYVDDGVPAWELRPATTTHNSLSGLQGGNSTERYHLSAAQHTDLTDGGDSESHKHDDRYYTETELGSTTGGSEGADLVGTDAKTNLGGADTVEEALTFIDGQDPPKFSSGAGNPNGSVAGAVNDRYLDTTNDVPYVNVDGANTGWQVM